MGAPSDPNIVWPDSFDDPGPPDPKLFALAMQLHAAGWPGSQAAGQDPGSSADGELAAHLLAARVLAAYNAAHPMTGVGPLPPSLLSGAPAGGPMPDGGPDQAPAFGPDGAPSAGDFAVPAGARVPGGGLAPGAAPSAALDPSSQFLRPELSGGPDPLLGALYRSNPKLFPPGDVVDPNTGAVSHWRAGAAGDALHPGGPVLEPLGPADKQSLLENVTGAGANYPLGKISPPEQTLRQLLSAQEQSAPTAQAFAPPSGPAARGDRNALQHTSPGGVRYRTAVPLSADQRNILEKIVDVGRSLGANSDLIETVAKQGFYESSLGNLRVNKRNPHVKGIFQYNQNTWNEAPGSNGLDIASDDDQIRMMYADAQRYRAKYEHEVGNGTLPPRLSFEDYLEMHHHLGDSSIRLHRPFPTDYHDKVKRLGLDVLSLPPR